MRGSVGGLGIGVALWAIGLLPVAEAAIVKNFDRKFPTGSFCPLETRAEAGADLSFVAEGRAARITFTVDNMKGLCSDGAAACLSNADCVAPAVCARSCVQSFEACSVDADCGAGDRCGPWNRLLLDNVTVVPLSVWTAENLLSPSPFFESCYLDDTIPPGQTTPGVLGAPSLDFNRPGTGVTERFDSASALTGWSGDVYYESSRSAPRVPAGPDFEDLDESLGSLGIGAPGDGTVPVSASFVVGGLTPNATYMVFGWWSIESADGLTLTIENVCWDADGDDRVVCDGCTLLAGQSCGDCDDARPHCATSCVDGDGDGWCVGTDCNDASATCTSDCTSDLDTDGVVDCRDGCVDPDRDGYGFAGGGTYTCSGFDCEEGNPHCNLDCTDVDADQACVPADCDDLDPTRYPGAPERNDCLDQQCWGDYGYGMSDETAGTSGFLSANKHLYSWPAQLFAQHYEVVRSSSPAFPPGCERVLRFDPDTSWLDPTLPPPGGVLYYLDRALTPCVGSWGPGPGGAERTGICGTEDCANGIDDDLDGSTDCADLDCAHNPACQETTFQFVDTGNDDIPDAALAAFFLALAPTASDYLFFEIDEGFGRVVAWCSVNAAFYRDRYLALAVDGGTDVSGAWPKWRRAPITGNVWEGPTFESQVNFFGNDCFGPYSWCSEIFPVEPANAIFPDRTNACEAYDLATGFCADTFGSSWTLTIKIGPTRLGTCGF